MADKIGHFIINHDLSFADQTSILMGHGMVKFLNGSARFDDTWKLISDQSLSFSGCDYKIVELTAFKKTILLSRLNFLGLDAVLPWTFINQKENNEQHVLTEWLDLLNKRFWELDILAKSNSSNARFLLYNTKVSKIIGSIIRELSDSKDNFKVLNNKSSKINKVIRDVDIENISVSENVKNIQIIDSNQAKISGKIPLGGRMAVGSKVPMKICLSVKIKMSENNNIRENRGDILGMISNFVDGIKSLDNVKFVVKGYNHINITFPGEAEDSFLGGQNCILGRFAHLSKIAILSLSANF